MDIDPAVVMNAHHRDTYGQCASLTCEDERGPSPWPCETYRLAEALAIERESVDEYDGILWRQGELLRGVADALNGPPPPLTSWSHHDLPEKAQAVVEALAASQAKVAQFYHVLTQYESGQIGKVACVSMLLNIER